MGRDLSPLVGGDAEGGRGRQPVSGVEQIASAMRNVNQATGQSLTSTRQAEKAAQNLNELVRSLSQTVAQYQL